MRPAGRAVPFASQLGGSQAGIRIAYRIDDAHRVALFGRVAGALSGRDTEAAAGIEWQPATFPARLFVEQRIGLRGARDAPAAGIVAGVDPVVIGQGFTIDGYGQAGAIGRSGVEGFADGAVRIVRPVASVGETRFDLAGGAWGGAQRGASRLDVGPSVVASVPVGEQRLRLTVDWRQRVAGNARPGSGLALTLGADF